MTVTHGSTHENMSITVYWLCHIVVKPRANVTKVVATNSYIEYAYIIIKIDQVFSIIMLFHSDV